jgi:ABC-type glycerol-3-phosphate transport system substrate-binding protein
MKGVKKMKKLLIALMVVISLVLVSGSTFAGSDDVQYKVTIKVVYNSVDAKKAAKIARDIAKDHADACSVNVELEKVTNDGTIYFYSNTITTDSK